jgi:hypothetical protein
MRLKIKETKNEINLIDLFNKQKLTYFKNIMQRDDFKKFKEASKNSREYI